MIGNGLVTWNAIELTIRLMSIYDKYVHSSGIIFVIFLHHKIMIMFYKLSNDDIKHDWLHVLSRTIEYLFMFLNIKLLWDLSLIYRVQTNIGCFWVPIIKWSTKFSIELNHDSLDSKPRQPGLVSRKKKIKKDGETNISQKLASKYKVIFLYFYFIFKFNFLFVRNNRVFLMDQWWIICLKTKHTFPLPRIYAYMILCIYI